MFRRELTQRLERLMNKVPAAVAATSLLGAFALSAALSAIANAAAPIPTVQPAGSEKCFGIAKAGKNDCAAGTHSCTATSTKNSDKASFVYLPTGACSKIFGASTTPGK
jgi:uncharacterized membrane protein